MFDGGDLGAAERLVDDWQAGFERRAAQARDLAGRLANNVASARSADGLVEVTVGQSGVVTELRLDEDIRRQPAARTARDILATIAAAHAVLKDQAADAVADTIGTDSETARAVLASFDRGHGGG